MKKVTKQLLLTLSIALVSKLGMAFGTDVDIAKLTNPISPFQYTKNHVAVAENGWIYAACFNTGDTALEISRSADGGHTGVPMFAWTEKLRE